MNAIGKLIIKKTVYCEICGAEYKRKMEAKVFNNTSEELKEVRLKLTKRAEAKYTCRICKSIVKDC